MNDPSQQVMKFVADGMNQMLEATRLMLYGGEMKVRLPGRGIARRMHVVSLGEALSAELERMSHTMY